MLEFKLSKASATLENLNVRTEKHGSDKVPAADLTISAALPADFLNVFSPVLPKLLWDDTAPKDLAEGMPLRDTHMVFPMGRAEGMSGVTAEIDFGIGEPMVFDEDVKVNQFKITPYAGGSAIVQWRVQCRPDQEQIGRLYVLQGKAITISIRPPQLPEMQEAA